MSIFWLPVNEGGQHGVVKFSATDGYKTFRLHLSVFGKCQLDPKAKVCQWWIQQVSAIIHNCGGVGLVVVLNN